MYWSFGESTVLPQGWNKDVHNSIQALRGKDIPADMFGTMTVMVTMVVMVVTMAMRMLQMLVMMMETMVMMMVMVTGNVIVEVKVTMRREGYDDGEGRWRW